MSERDLFSSRVPSLENTNPFMAKAQERRATDPDFLNLIETNPTQAGLIFESVPSLPMSPTYDPDPRGLASARKAVAEYYGPHVDPDDIVLTASTSEAYSFLFKLLGDSKDEVLVPSPSYPLFEHLTMLEGLVPKTYALGYTGRRWTLDFNTLLGPRSKRSRALVVVHPNNPTGSYLNTHEIERLGGLTGELPLIVDEVFFDYPEPELPFTPVRIADHHRESLVFSLGGLSKLCSLPQAKLAWIRVSGPDEPKRAALERLAFIADAYLSVSTAIQDAAPLLLENRFSIQRRIRERISRNATFLRDAIRSTSSLIERAREGGWYAVLELPSGWSDEAFALALLEEGVLVHPGYFYDFEEENLIVTSLLTPEPGWEKGIKTIAARAGRNA